MTTAFSERPLVARRYAGAVYDPATDDARLDKQLGRIYDCMTGGGWRTLAEIASITGDHEASISAQLRHLRKPWFGGYVVEKRHRGEATRGLYEYRVMLPPPCDGQQLELPL